MYQGWRAMSVKRVGQVGCIQRARWLGGEQKAVVVGEGRARTRYEVVIDAMRDILTGDLRKV